MRKIAIIFVFYLALFNSIIGQEDSLNVPMVKQIKSQWCWAACAAMIDSFYFGTNNHSQCEFAILYLNKLYSMSHNLDCDSIIHGLCNEPSHNLMNKNGNTPFSFSSNFKPRFEQVLSYIGLYSSFEINPPFSEIKNEIDNDRPLIAFVSTTSSNVASHMVVVKGYKKIGSDMFLILNDPWFHSGASQCGYTSTRFFNYTGTNQTGSIKSIVAFQMNIHPKNMVLSSPASFMTTRSLVTPTDSNMTTNLIEDDTVRMPVKVLSANKLKNCFPSSYRKKFLTNEVFELYSPSAMKSYVNERTSKGWTLTEIKNAKYPTQLLATKGRDTLVIKNLNNGKISLWQYPLPPFHYFYEYEHNGKTVIIPLNEVNQRKGNTLLTGTYYAPKVVLNRLRKHNRFFFGTKPFLFFGKKKGSSVKSFGNKISHKQ